MTVEQFIERVSQLYEQNVTASRIEEYARRWLIWVRSGFQRVEFHNGAEVRELPLLYGASPYFSYSSLLYSFSLP